MQACKKAAQSTLSESKTMRKETNLRCLHSERELLSDLNARNVSESLWIVQSLAELRRSCWSIVRGGIISIPRKPQNHATLAMYERADERTIT